MTGLRASPLGPVQYLGGLSQTDQLPELFKFRHLFESFSHALREMLLIFRKSDLTHECSDQLIGYL